MDNPGPWTHSKRIICAFQVGTVWAQSADSPADLLLLATFTHQQSSLTKRPCLFSKRPALL